MEAPISQEKQESLRRRLESLGLREEDLEERFVRGSGSGGQKVNKTASAVYLKHAPSGLEIKCQKSRSQANNRFFARRELADRYESEVMGQKTKRIRLRTRRASKSKGVNAEAAARSKILSGAVNEAGPFTFLG